MTAKDSGVHITAGGFEYDRVLVPMLNKYPVDKLVMFRSKASPYTEARDLAGEFLTKLKDNPIDIDIVKLDIYDFNDVFINTLDQIKKYAEKGKKVYINISPVPKLATVAMISAAFLSRYKDSLEIFYASPKDYLIPKMMEYLSDIENKDSLDRLKELGDRFMKNGTAVGVQEYQEIPVFPIKEINDVDMEILKTIKEKEGVQSIEELVETINENRKEEIKRSSVQYRLERLEEKRMLDTEREDRRLKIRLNRLGEVYLEGCMHS